MMRFVLFAFGVVGIALKTNVADALDEYPIEVHAVAQCSPASVLLSMSLTNGSKKYMEFYKSDLPWGTKSSIVLVLVSNSPDPEMIKPALYIDDPGPDLLSVDASAEGRRVHKPTAPVPELARGFARARCAGFLVL